MGRVLALGLDAVDAVDVERRLAAGALPHLAALRARGSWRPVEVDPRCCAEHPWPTFATGREPGRGGCWTTVTFDPATYHDANIGAPDLPPFWAGAGIPVVTLDVPNTRPAPSVPGAQVLDWGAHDPGHQRCSVPAGLLADLEARFGPNPAAPLEYAGTWTDATWIEAYGAALVASIEARVVVAEHLLATNPWQLGVITFGEPHQLDHHVWHGVDDTSILHHTPTAGVAARVAGEVLTALDAAVGRMAAALGPDDVVVVFSPKGAAGRSDVAANVLVPELLHRLAFGEPRLRQPSGTRWARRGRPPVVPPAGTTNVAVLQAAFGRSALARARHAVRATALRAADAVAEDALGRARLRRRLAQQPIRGAPDVDDPQPIVADLPYDDWMVAAWYRPWWPRQRVFALPSFSDVHLRVNVAGREAQGVVPAADYERAADEVEAVLRACRNPRTGNPLVDRVERTRGDDPWAEVGLAADLVVGITEDTDALEHPDVGLVGPYPAWRSGSHAARAFALFAGPSIEPGEGAPGRLVDLSATLVALAGGDPTAAPDGRPLAVTPVSGAG